MNSSNEYNINPRDDKSNKKYNILYNLISIVYSSYCLDTKEAAFTDLYAFLTTKKNNYR
ncbi:hypothetical protein [uncultured Brachyspira sp.]|uniref:hypothetical protein n=1 Tax=uncultured Brachyspira sp. TaxID=221953 RepID=UPI00263341B1|nr:hypothetical protein [uncultured Brachyspira sp.]